MSLVDRLWEHVQGTQKNRPLLAPPRATDIWEDLTKVRVLAHAQSLEIGDLREAVSYLADTVQALTNRVEDLERGAQ